MLRRNQGQAPYGFKWQGGCLLQVAEEVLVVQDIFRGMAETGAVSAVVKKLRTSGHMSRRGGAWSDVQVGRVLRCSAAIGKYEVGRNGSQTAEFVECDPIVSQEVWDRVQDLLGTRRGSCSNPDPTMKPETLSGLIWCGCGQRMERVTDAAKFRCPGCRQSVTEEMLGEIFAEDFWEVLEANPVLNAAIDERPAVREAAVKLAGVERERAEVERERATAERLFSDRAISLKRMEALVHPLEVKARSLDKSSLEFRNLLAKKVKNFSKKSDWAEMWKGYSSERRWSVMKTFLDRIEVEVEEIQLSYRIAEFPLLTSPKDRSENQQIGEPTNQESADEALYIRLPKPGQRCPITGLGRAKLNELILPNARNKHRPPVESISLKQPGQTKGVRLIVRKSLLEFCRKSGLKLSGNSEMLARDDDE